MIAKILAALGMLSLLAVDAAAQSRLNLETFGRIVILEVSSAELADVLQLVKAKIAVSAFADKWEMSVGVLTQDAVVANVITLERGKQLFLAPKTTSDPNLIFFIARTLRVTGPANQPVTIIWDKNIPGLMREPVSFGKASNGLPGEREGADGKPGANGVQGNRGLRAPDAPAVVLIALKIEGPGPLLFQLEGQNGGSGGAGQDGGDGGAGRSGRPGVIVANPLGVSIKREPTCEPALRGGNGGHGGNGGLGGAGGPGGGGGGVALISLDIGAEAVKRLIDPASNLTGGKRGHRGLRGLGGKGGAGGPAVEASAPCDPSPAGSAGEPGSGRDPDRPDTPESEGPSVEGSPGSVIYSKLNDSQARAIGLLPGGK